MKTVPLKLLVRRIAAIVLVWYAISRIPLLMAAFGGTYSCGPGNAPAAVRCGTSAFDVPEFVGIALIISCALGLALVLWRGYWLHKPA